MHIIWLIFLKLDWEKQDFSDSDHGSDSEEEDEYRIAQLLQKLQKAKEEAAARKQVYKFGILHFQLFYCRRKMKRISSAKHFKNSKLNLRSRLAIYSIK